MNDYFNLSKPIKMFKYAFFVHAAITDLCILPELVLIIVCIRAQHELNVQSR